MVIGALLFLAAALLLIGAGGVMVGLWGVLWGLWWAVVVAGGLLGVLGAGLVLEGWMTRRRGV